MAPHEAVIGAQVGELLPGVAGHPGQDRALAVHHLVVAERQDEVLGEGVEQAEGHLVVMPAAMGRVLAHIFQGVVHPPHVPLVAEAQAAGPGRLRHARPGGGFLGHGHDARMLAIGQLVHPAHEVDRFQVLAPAELVGHPLARLARVVEVEHRGHRIDPQPVDMVAVEPEQRVGVQVVDDLGPAEIVDQGAPVLVEALARIRVLVERGAVEAAEAVRVGREMPGHPVQQHAQARLVAAVDEAGEVVRRAVAAGGREQADRLVAPGAVERVLVDRQQLEMGEAHVDGVGDQALGELVVGQEAVALAARPGAEMHLEDADRRRRPPARRRGAASQAASLQVKSSIRRTTDAFCGRSSPPVPTGSAFKRQQRAVGGAQLELVDRPLAEPGDEDLPDADPAAPPHRVAPAVPAVEVADHRDARRVRRPDREMHARHAGMLDRMRAQPLPQAPMRALADQIVVHLAQDRREAVGVVHLPACRRRCGRAGCSRTRPAGPRARPRTGPPRGGDFSSPTTAPVPSSTTSSRAAPGTSARITTPPGTSCGPSTANGSSCRASTSARTVASGEATLRGACHSCPPSPINRGTSEKRAPDQSILPVQSAAAELHLNSLCIIGRDFNSLCITMRRVWQSSDRAIEVDDLCDFCLSPLTLQLECPNTRETARRGGKAACGIRRRIVPADGGADGRQPLARASSIWAWRT